MHKRTLLIGIGIGIIIGAVLVELFNLGSSGQQRLELMEQQMNQSSNDPDLLTPNLEIDSDNTNEMLQEEEQSSGLQSSEGENEQGAASEEALLNNEENDALSDDTLLEDGQHMVQEGTETVVDEQNASKRYILRIEPGKSITHTAALLQRHHIISDQKSFTSLLTKDQTEIRAGYFLVEENSTNERLKEIITSTPLTESQWKSYNEDEGLEIIL